MGRTGYDPRGPQNTIPGGGGPGTPKKKKRRPPTPTPPQQPREPAGNQPGGTPGGPGPGQTYPQAPVYHPPAVPDYQAQYEKSVKNLLLNQRVSTFAPHVVQQAPFLVGSLVFSGATNEAIQRISKGLDGAWNWLAQPMTPQVLATLMQMYPTKDAAVEGLKQQLAAGAIDWTQYQQMAAQYAAGLGDQVIAAHEKLSQGMTPQEQRAVLEERKAEVRAQFGPDYGVNTLNWINNRLYDVGSAFSGGNPALERQLNPDIQQDPAGYATKALTGAIVTPFAAPFAAASAGLGMGGNLLDKPTIPGTDIRFLHPLRAGLDFGLKYPSQVFRWIGEESNKAGETIATLSGLKPGTPEFQGVSSLAAFLIQIEGGKVFATTSGALREGYRNPREQLFPQIDKAELKAAAKEAGLRGVKTPEAAFRARWGNTITGVRGPVAHAHGWYAEMIAKMVNLPSDKWMTVKGMPGRRFADFVAKSNRRSAPGERTGALIESSRNLDPRLAATLSGAESWQEAASIMTERFRKPAEEDVIAKKQLIDDLNAKLRSDEPMTGAERGDAVVEIAKARHWLDNLKPDEPIFRVPRKSIIRAIQTGTGGRVVRFLNHLYDPVMAPGVMNLSRLFDDAPKSDYLHWHDSPGAPADALAQNAAVLTKILRRVGVGDTRVRRIITRMSEAKTESQFYDALVRDLSSAIEDSSRIAPDMKKALTERWKGDLSERHKSFRTEELISKQDFTGVQHSTDFLTTRNEYQQTHPSPSQSSQLLRGVPLFDHEMAIEATSYVRRLTRGLRRVATTDEGKQKWSVPGVAARAPLVPMDLVKGLLDAGTAIGKPLTLVMRSLGALPLRIQGEQGLRNYFWGFKPGVRKGGLAWEEAKANPELMRALGAIVRDPIEPVNTITRYTDHDFTNNRLPVNDRLEMSPNQKWALHEQFTAARSSFEVVELVKRGPDDFVAWATGDSGGAQKFKQTFGPIFDRSNELQGRTWQEQARWWADEKYKEMQALAGGREDLLQAISHGRWDVRGGHFEDAVRAGLGKITRAEEYQGLLDEKATLDGHITDINRDGLPGLAEWDFSKDIAKGLTHRQAMDNAIAGVKRAYQDARLEVIDKLKAFEAEGIGRDMKLWSVSLDHPESFMDQLASEHLSGDYTPPPKVQGSYREVPRDLNSRGKIRNAYNWRRATETALYAGMKSVSLADIKGTRGSLFYQIWRQRFAELAAWHGTSDVEYLKTQAMWRAARETADLHYDLAARSSAHRFLRNFFWFLPAYQEVLTTWAIKLPSRYGHGVGQMYLGNQLSALNGLLHAPLFHGGSIVSKGPPTQTNPKGDERIVIPGAAQFFNDLLPGTPFTTKGPNATIISFKPSGLNLIAGNQLPTVSPAVAIPLGKMAREYGGVYKTLSDALTFNGADTALAPSGLNYLIEAITGKPSFLEQFSQPLLQNINDSAFDDSLAMAYYTLGSDGIKLPDPKDFKTTGSYTKAREQYLSKWMAEARHIQQGRFLVKAFGATMFPASLSITSKYREDFMRTWWKITGGKALTDGLSPEQSAQLNAWIEAHPNGLAYRVFRNAKGDPVKPLPYDAVDFNDLYYTGQLKAISPEDFQNRVMVFESNRHFGLQRNEVYAGMNWVEALMSYNKVHTQIDAINGEQEKWRLLNKVAVAQMDEYIASFPDQASKTIVSIQEADRLQAVVSGLKALAPMFTSGGQRDADWKKVLGVVQGALSATGEFGAPTTDVMKGIAWYITNVVSPYMEQVLPLYDQADRFSAAGADEQASATYAKIRHINNTFSSGQIIGPQGLVAPPPEAYFFAHLKPVEQQRRILHWATEPTGWLTDFQRQQSGIAEDPKYTKMFDAAAQYMLWYKGKYLDPYSPGSRQYDSNVQWRDDQITSWVKKNYGDEGIRQYQLSVAPPYLRLQEVDFGATVPNWQRIVDSAKYYTDRIIAHGNSPTGDTSAEQIWAKQESFFPGIDALRKKDPALDRLFTDLGYATATGGRAYREGPQLYDALFFNNWASRIVPNHPNIYKTIGPGATPDPNSPYAKFRPATWPTAYPNGHLPLDRMVSVGTGTTAYAVNGNYYLRPDAAMSFQAMQQKAGFAFPIANAYRTYEQQAAIYRTGVQAAAAGHSDHGLGLAFDLDGNSPDYQRAHDWILAHAHQYGWINSAVVDPIWGKGGWASEVGHFSFYAGGGTGGGSGSQYGLPNQALDRRWIVAARQYTPGSQSGTGTTTALTTPKGLDNVRANRTLGKQLAAQRGWGADQFKYIRYIVEGHGSTVPESGWKGSAENPSSGALGIGQRYLKPWPWLSQEDQQSYTTDVKYQLTWMYDYITQRYGTPQKAWEYKVAHGGY